MKLAFNLIPQFPTNNTTKFIKINKEFPFFIFFYVFACLSISIIYTLHTKQFLIFCFIMLYLPYYLTFILSTSIFVFFQLSLISNFLNNLNLFNDFIVNELEDSLGVLFWITGAYTVNIASIFHCLGCFGGLKWEKIIKFSKIEF